jgi:hypothetical protein
MVIITPYRCIDILEAQCTVRLIWYCVRMNAADRGNASALIEEHMTTVTKNDLLTPLAMGQHTYQITHGSAAHQQRRFFAHQSSGMFLQAVDRRILAENIITQFRIACRLAHLVTG